MSDIFNQEDVRVKLLEIITYHGDDGTSGYCLSNSQIEKVMGLILDTYSQGMLNGSYNN